MGILIFKGLTARRLYKSFGVKGLISIFHLRLRIPGDQFTYSEKYLVCFSTLIIIEDYSGGEADISASNSVNRCAKIVSTRICLILNGYNKCCKIR
jgi:hypothetical protein